MKPNIRSTSASIETSPLETDLENKHVKRDSVISWRGNAALRGDVLN